MNLHFDESKRQTVGVCWIRFFQPDPVPEFFMPNPPDPLPDYALCRNFYHHFTVSSAVLLGLCSSSADCYNNIFIFLLLCARCI